MDRLNNSDTIVFSLETLVEYMF